MGDNINSAVFDKYLQEEGGTSIEMEQLPHQHGLITEETDASESLSLVMRQLERDSLQDAEYEIGALKEKVESLERDLMESKHCLGVAKEEAYNMAKKIVDLKFELELVKEEKAQAQNNEKLAAFTVQSLLHEKNLVISELENFKEEEEKSKKAMEIVSAETREAEESLLSNQVESDLHIEYLMLVIKEGNQRYEVVEDNAKHEIEIKPNFLNCAKKSKDENSTLEREIDRPVNLLMQTEEEACETREEEAQLKDSLNEIESLKLKESLSDKENELQNPIREKEELQTSCKAYSDSAPEVSRPGIDEPQFSISPGASNDVDGNLKDAIPPAEQSAEDN